MNKAFGIGPNQGTLLVLIASEDYFRLIILSNFPSFFVIICFLQLMGALEHDLFLNLFMSFYGPGSLFWLGLESFFVLSLCILLDVLFNGVCQSFINLKGS
jgi:hypothetical protein